MPNPLPVPHVEQTGVCGIAAWASVLNYRFNTQYTNASLASAMAKKHITSPNGSPYMTDYRDYANDVHNAGCVFKTSLSFLNLTDTIGRGRPIMGSWISGDNCHAVIITGYIKNGQSNYTYIIKNPWYNYTQIITVTDSSSVIYRDAGYTWKLSQVVY